MRIAICDDEKVFAENILRKLKFEILENVVRNVVLLR